MAWRPSDTHGGTGGAPFTDDLTQVVRLAGFNIRSGSLVDAIQPVFLNCGGGRVTGPWHGGSGGGLQNIVFAADEVIQNFDGRSGWYVDQLTITTNKQTYGPFGGSGGSPFSEDRLDVVGGFFGRSGSYLDQIGVFTPCPS
ncbi:MAG: jacalin-like lectin domain protein [Actinomycetota bacterium]|nr:jacalin-like lectin domain protein [Actinomycetota bacterium]